MQISPINTQYIRTTKFKGNTQEAAVLIKEAKSKILSVVENKVYLGAKIMLSETQKESRLYDALMSLSKALDKLSNN